MRAERLKMSFSLLRKFAVGRQITSPKSRTTLILVRQTVSKPTFLKIVFGEISVRNLKYGNCGAVYLVLRQTAVVPHAKKRLTFD